MNPKVSIIIPTYNSIDTIFNCVDSCINLKYDNKEIIVIDDGSTDSSFIELKNKYKNKIILIKQENSGPFEARKKGLRNSTGKFIMFVDSDDRVYPNYITDLLNFLINNNLDIAKCKTSLSINDPYECKTTDIYYGEEKILEALINNKIQSTMPFTIYKREIISIILNLDTGSNVVEDLYCAHLIYGKAKSVGVLNKVLYEYNKTKNGRNYSPGAATDALKALVFRHLYIEKFHPLLVPLSMENILKQLLANLTGSSYYKDQYYKEIKKFIKKRKHEVKGKMLYMSALIFPRVYHFYKNFIRKK